MTKRYFAALVLLLAAAGSAAGQIDTKTRSVRAGADAISPNNASHPPRAGAAKPPAHSPFLRIDGVYDFASHEESLVRAFDQPSSSTQRAAEEITVFARRGQGRDTEWRGALLAQEPVYEAANSQAAQRLYAAGPEWAGPEHQRLMSDIKDFAGLCGTLGGLITCPNR